MVGVLTSIREFSITFSSSSVSGCSGSFIPRRISNTSLLSNSSVISSLKSSGEAWRLALALYTVGFRFSSDIILQLNFTLVMKFSDKSLEDLGHAIWVSSWARVMVTTTTSIHGSMNASTILNSSRFGTSLRLHKIRPATRSRTHTISVYVHVNRNSLVSDHFFTDWVSFSFSWVCVWFVCVCACARVRWLDQSSKSNSKSKPNWNFKVGLNFRLPPYLFDKSSVIDESDMAIVYCILSNGSFRRPSKDS